ncbi:DNA-binding SARP family transcriptional activator [Lentzea atacamensis]|uniref:DNA-binding SARP family transcriptional activator n=1 Tax=Lentzea atacamensis TaxID=531938 RepID=A0ABX9EL81_9PSEU|nr:BTAD domain-containing putative transcriptional regulator [Lentzea atacamensis]RAS70482.1 DNA-binding SARP family transcriptional activator [Lentzea atacamensis]
MRVNLLGTVELVAGDEEPVPLAASKRRAVLAALALELNRVVSGDRLLSLVWDGAPPPQAKAALQGHVAQLRKLLGSTLDLVTRAPGYALVGDRHAVDVFRFEDLVTSAWQADDATAAERLTSALQLWRGPFLADVPGRRLHEAYEGRLDELRLAAVEQLGARLIELGRAAEAVTSLRAEVADHPLREPLVARLVLALHRTGRQAEALDFFGRTRTQLADELGVDPGPELRAAHQAVLTDVDPSPRPARPPVQVPAQLPHEHRGFVGRDAELSQLDGLLGDAGIGLLAGPPGVGKTALALRWAHRVADRFPDGQLFIDLRGFAERKPLEAKTALVGFLRALGVENVRLSGGLDALAAQYRSLLAHRRVLVVLDNARSVEQVRPLLPGSPRCLVLVTSRHGLDDLVVTEGAAVLGVGTLDDHTAAELLTAGLGRHRTEPEPAAATELIDLCDGLPLALRIVSARLASRPRWTIQALVDELRDEQSRLAAFTLPEQGRGVQSALAVSYRELPEGAARTFRGLGLHPGTDIDSYAAAALLDVNVVTARTHLRTVASASLLHESTPDRYVWHDLVRLFTRQLVAGEDNSVSVERLSDYYLHVADAARALLSDQPEPVATPVHRPASFPELTSYRSAMEWFELEEHNLRLLLEAGHQWRTWQLALCLDAFYAQNGNVVDRVKVCRAGLSAARGDVEAEARLLTSEGAALADLGELEAAVRETQRAVRLARGEVEGRARANLGYCLAATGNFTDARERIQEALEITRATGDLRAQAAVLDRLANALLCQNKAAEALAPAREALALHASLPLSAAQVAALYTVGSVLRATGRFSSALRTFEDGLRLAEEVRDFRHVALFHLVISELLPDAEPAAAHRDAARTIHRRLGVVELPASRRASPSETRRTEPSP